MRYEHPKAAMHANGIYGGIGSRPADEPWTPEVHEEAAAPETVPERLRHLRLHRTRPRHYISNRSVAWVLVPIALIVMVLALFLAEVVTR